MKSMGVIQPRSHQIRRTIPEHGNQSPPVTLNLHSKLKQHKKIRIKMKDAFEKHSINPMLVEGTPLNTIYENAEEEEEDNITYVEDEYEEIVALENKIRSISVHILTNILVVNESPTTAAPSPFYTFSFDKKVEILQDLL